MRFYQASRFLGMASSLKNFLIPEFALGQFGSTELLPQLAFQFTWIWHND